MNKLNKTLTGIILGASLAAGACTPQPAKKDEKIYYKSFKETNALYRLMKSQKSENAYDCIVFSTENVAEDYRVEELFIDKLCDGSTETYGLWITKDGVTEKSFIDGSKSDSDKDKLKKKIDPMLKEMMEKFR